MLIGTGLAMLVGLVVVDIITYLLVTRAQLRQVDDALQRAHPPTEQLAQGSSDNWPLIPEIAPGLYVAILDPSGSAAFTAAARQPGEDPITIAVADVDLDQRHQTVSASDGEDLRLRVDPLPDDATLLVGQSLHEVNETRSQLLWVLVGASTAAIAATLALAWWLIRVGLRPLRSIEASAAAITDQDLGDARVPETNQTTEVGRLAHALNAMLERLDRARSERETTLDALQASEARMRQFVADASHELRTPMAATAAYTELFDAGARDRPADLERAMAGIRSETARMSELIDDLLLLAHLDEARPLRIEPVDLTEITLAAVDAARTLEPKRTLNTRISGVVTTRGDAARLRQVIDNLLANVRTHTPTEAACQIALTAEHDEAVLTIADTGPGVSHQHLTRLGNRFYRVDNARSRTRGGSGLGLAIITAIVHAHHGTITYTDNQPHGLTVTIRLPLSTPDNPQADEPE
jgi:two-component system OmpR family sensor kinase